MRYTDRPVAESLGILSGGKTLTGRSAVILWCRLMRQRVVRTYTAFNPNLVAPFDELITWCRQRDIDPVRYLTAMIDFQASRKRRVNPKGLRAAWYLTLYADWEQRQVDKSDGTGGGLVRLTIAEAPTRTLGLDRIDVKNDARRSIRHDVDRWLAIRAQYPKLDAVDIFEYQLVSFSPAFRYVLGDEDDLRITEDIKAALAPQHVQDWCRAQLAKANLRLWHFEGGDPNVA